MMARNEFSTGGHLQPAADTSVATGSLSIAGLREITGTIRGGGFKLGIELDEAGARGWLQAFAQVIDDLRAQRASLAYAARVIAHTLPIGHFETSDWVKERVATRLGGAGTECRTEGLADIISAMVTEMTKLHEAFRVALAEHLGADLEGERVLNRLNQEGHG